jgi:hypothetical protein
VRLSVRVCAPWLCSASQLRARHAEADSASPVLMIGAVAALVIIGGAFYFLF